MEAGLAMSRCVLIAILVCGVMLPSPIRGQVVTPDSSGAQGYLAGRDAGHLVPTKSTVLLGAVSGLVGSFSIPAAVLGTRGKTAYIGLSAASVAFFIGVLRLDTDLPRDQEDRIQGRPAVFREQFRKGYADEVRHQRLVPAFIGGAVGAALGGAFVWYLSQALAGD
jgi:hypothetical protein